MKQAQVLTDKDRKRVMAHVSRSPFANRNLLSDNHLVRCRQPSWPVGLTEDGHARL